MSANLSSSILVPGVYVTMDNSLANTALGGSFKTVLIGQQAAWGTATVETFTQVFSYADAEEKFGVGSLLATMFDEWFSNNTVNEVYAISLDDNAAGTTPAIGATFAGTATATGSIYMYINGKRVVVPVAIGDSATVVGDAFETAINADLKFAVTAVNAIGTVTLTAKYKGTVANQITIKENMGVSETTPAGITTTLGNDQTGANDPDIADAIAALPDEVINLIINPYTDATNLTALDTELSRRWGNTVQVDGHAIQSYGGTSSVVGTKGDTLNSEHLTFMDSGKSTMVPPFMVAPSVGGQVAGSASVDPARPFRTLQVAGMIGDIPTDRRNFTEKNSILLSGISTHSVQADSTVTIDRLVTTYKTNALGAIDTSYRNTNTMFNLSFLRQSFVTRMLSRFPRHKLADDGTVFGSGQAIATPAVIKGEIIQLYKDWIALGLVEDLDTFSDSLSVERDTVNRSRVNVVMQPELVGQFYQIDNTLQFIV